jgi:hypothetical protein
VRAQIIVSCIFSMAEQSCPTGTTGPDSNFDFLVESTTWELPVVRVRNPRPFATRAFGTTLCVLCPQFDYEVSPPPPPPAELSIMQSLSLEDAHGYSLARRTLDELFPSLKYVATSSAGGSVGRFIVDEHMSQHQLTKAFLASHGMEPDSLGARIVESRHTGVWRKACREIVRFLNDHSYSSPGRDNPYGSAFAGAADHDSRYDRNLLLYITTEVALQLGLGTGFGVLSTWDIMCEGGYRVPTETDFYDTYNFDPDTELTLFFPFVGHGSLGALQSQWLSRAGCAGLHSHGQFREDLAMQIRCNGLRDAPPEAFLVGDHNQRAYFSPTSMQQRYCMPKFQITVEDALSKPPLFAEALTDTAYKTTWNYDNLVASANQRGEESVELRYRQLSMRGLVYVTSSHDANYPPGVYRLLDLPVFSRQGCREMPRVDCASAGTTVHNQFQAPRSGGGPVSGYYTGREIVPRLRCRAEVAAATGVACTPEPYLGLEGCAQTNLALGTAPQLYSSAHWLGMLHEPPPPPPRPPPASPPPSPSPCPSPPPPAAPVYLDQRALMRRIRAAEETACASVYYRTTADRCETLAVAMAERVLWTGLPPPLPPPGLPTALSPPPPPPPPSPAMPEGMADVPCRSATLSTMRVPSSYSARLEAGALVNDGYMLAPGAQFDAAAYAAAPFDRRARCVAELGAAPMPCVSGVAQPTCLDSGRRCGDAAANGKDPWLELRLFGKPADRRRYLWGLRVRLPESAELAALFFASAETDSAGYRLELYAWNGARIDVPSGYDVQARVPEDRELLIQTARAGASDETLYRLGEVAYVRIVLPGEYRQLWVRWVQPVERGYPFVEGLLPRPPMPPPRPVQPPQAPGPPAGACDFHPGHFAPDSVVLERRDEPCGLDAQACCDHAAAFAKTTADGVMFHVSDGGCCILLRVSAAVWVPVDVRVNFLTAAAGVGVVR